MEWSTGGWVGITQSVQQLATGCTVRGSNPGGGRDFPHPSRPALGPNQPPYTMDTGVNLPGRGVDHLPHLAPKLKKEQSYTSTPPLDVRGLFQCELMEHWWYDTDRANPKNLKKETCRSATLFIKIPVSISVESNLDLRSERKATGRLSHGPPLKLLPKSAEQKALLSWRWKQQILPRRRYLSTKLHGITSQNINL